MKKYIAMAAVILAATVSCNKSGVEGNDVDLENISSDVNSLYVIQSGLTADPDGFNMLTDGGFERFAGSGEWKDKSLFWLNEDIAESEEPCTGSRSIRLFFDGEGWKDLAIQTVNLKKGQSYTLSLNYRAAWKGCNCYMGFRATETHDQNTNDPERNDAWDEGYSYTWENIDDIQADVFFGGFWWYNLWAELDDMRVIPTGSSNDSFIPANAGITAQSIPSAAKTVVESAERAVFSTDGTSGMLHNAVISGETVENVYVTSAFNKAGKLVIATAEATDIKGFIPTAVVKTDGVVYIHGYSEIVPGGAEDEAATVSGAAILSSADGKTWKTAVELPENTHFAKAAFCKNGNYVYIYGAPADENARNTYLARVPAASVGNSGEYEYWDGETYIKGSEEIAASIFYGPTDYLSVVYNQADYAYMAVYRSSTTGQLVYRDAGLAEGEWSGEKLLVSDPEEKALYAPQIVSNSAAGLMIVASAK